MFKDFDLDVFVDENVFFIFFWYWLIEVLIFLLDKLFDLFFVINFLINGLMILFRVLIFFGVGFFLILGSINFFVNFEKLLIFKLLFLYFFLSLENVNCEGKLFCWE